jgi:hypothetical protein
MNKISDIKTLPFVRRLVAHVTEPQWVFCLISSPNVSLIQSNEIFVTLLLETQNPALQLLAGSLTLGTYAWVWNASLVQVPDVPSSRVTFVLKTIVTIRLIVKAILLATSFTPTKTTISGTTDASKTGPSTSQFPNRCFGPSTASLSVGRVPG